MDEISYANRLNPNETVFPVKFQLGGFCVPLTTEKWGYREKNRGTKHGHNKIIKVIEL